jgi:hypothetical protein
VLFPREKGPASIMVLKIGISRPLAKSQQAVNNHKIQQEFNTQVMEKMDGKAERGRITN